MSPLNFFFAVTASGSLYEVVYTNDRAVARKICFQGGKENNVGVGDQLNGGDIVIVTPNGLYAYSSEKRQLGGNSTAIVALFLDAEAAKACLESQDIQPLDPRWHRETEMVLATIGDDHPVFTIFIAGEHSFQYPNDTASPTTE
jgi:hypothetical protein